LKSPQSSYDLLVDYYLVFFKQLFDAVEKELGNEKFQQPFQSHGDLALAWRDHLGQSKNDSAPRDTLYKQLLGNVCLYILSIPHPNLVTQKDLALAHSRSVGDPKSDASAAVKKLLGTIDALVTGTAGDAKDVRLMMYFDEAHTLLTHIRNDRRSFYDALCAALSSLDSPRLFSIMLSTNCSLCNLSPSQFNYRVYQWLGDPTQAPWTEMNFDFPFNDPIIRPKEYSLAELASTETIVKFGRPL
jgi:hypothetical protein